MLGTFQAEESRPHYGLTKPVHTQGSGVVD
ncbi:hypothetical protein BB170200_02715 [Mycobacterium marinum]|nr:hypothetical protein BB170200_02715 [Mycobacterium marinum]